MHDIFLQVRSSSFDHCHSACYNEASSRLCMYVKTLLQVRWPFLVLMCSSHSKSCRVGDGLFYCVNFLRIVPGNWTGYLLAGRVPSDLFVVDIDIDLTAHLLESFASAAYENRNLRSRCELRSHMVFPSSSTVTEIILKAAWHWQLGPAICLGAAL